MAYPTTDWPGATDAVLTRVNLVDIIDADDFNYPDEQIRSIQDWLGDGQGAFIGDTATAADGAGGLVSPVASGGVAFTLAARADFVAGKLLSIQDNYDVAAAELLSVSFDGKVTAQGLTLGATAPVVSILDEDAMGSDSDTALATQQSIKAYVDTAVAAVTPGGPGTDTTAIHDNVAQEIQPIAAKASPVGADVVVIEDSAASWAKKSVTITNLLAGAGGGAVTVYADVTAAKAATGVGVGDLAWITTLATLYEYTPSTGATDDLHVMTCNAGADRWVGAAGRYNATGRISLWASALSGTGSFGIGDGALAAGSPGNNTIAIGRGAGSTTIGAGNTLVGDYCYGPSAVATGLNQYTCVGQGILNSAGVGGTSAGGTYIGYRVCGAAVGHASNDDFNTFVGWQVANTIGSSGTTARNTITGAASATTINGASYVTGSGYGVFPILTSGDNNTAHGAGAGAKITTGTGGLFLGRSAGPTSNQSDKLYINNSESDSPLIWGDFSAGLVDFNASRTTAAWSAAAPVLAIDYVGKTSTGALGSLVFEADDAGGNAQDYAAVLGRSVDAADASEDGQLDLQVAVAGSLTTKLELTSAGVRSPTTAGYYMSTAAGAVGAVVYGYRGSTDTGRWLDTSPSVGTEADAVSVEGAKVAEFSSAGLGIGVNGSSSAPSVYWTGDTGTNVGLYLFAENKLGITAGAQVTVVEGQMVQNQHTTSAPKFSCYNTNTSLGGSGDVGIFDFRGRDSGNAETIYAQLVGQAVSQTSPNEEGQFDIEVCTGGALKVVAEFRGGNIYGLPGWTDNVQTVTSTSNQVDIDCEDGLIVRHALTENTTIQIPTNGVNGMILTLILVGASTGYTVAFDNSAGGFATQPGFDGAGIAAGEFATIQVIYDSTLGFWLPLPTNVFYYETANPYDA